MRVLNQLNISSDTTKQLMETVDSLWNIVYHRKYKSRRDIVISDHSYLDLPPLLLTVDWDSLLRRQKLILTYFIIRDVFGADDTSASYARTNPFYFKLWFWYLISVSFYHWLPIGISNDPQNRNIINFLMNC